MELHLAFQDQKVTGGGADQEGNFSIDGRFDAEGVVSFLKSYPRDFVAYSGRWDGAMIRGNWSFSNAGPDDQGTFEIWPTGEDPHRLPAEAKAEEAPPTAKRGSFGSKSSQ